MIKNFINNLRKKVRKDRISRYGLSYVVLEVLVLICHRRGTFFEHWLNRKKDIKVKEYLNKNYSSVIEKWYR
jgi:hypothetical protein